MKTSITLLRAVFAIVSILAVELIFGTLVSSHDIPAWMSLFGHGTLAATILYAIYEPAPITSLEST